MQVMVFENVIDEIVDIDVYRDQFPSFSQTEVVCLLKMGRGPEQVPHGAVTFIADGQGLYLFGVECDNFFKRQRQLQIKTGGQGGLGDPPPKSFPDAVFFRVDNDKAG